MLWIKKSFEVKSVKSSCSGKSQSTASTRLSRSSAGSRLIEAAAKTARLEVEMKFLEEEPEVRRLQLRKELALANAEEETIKKILDEEVVMSKDKGHVTRFKESKAFENKAVKTESKPIVADSVARSKEPKAVASRAVRIESIPTVADLLIKREPFTSNHISATTLPVVDSRLAPLPTQHQEQGQALELEGATLRDLVAIQTKQAQLCLLYTSPSPRDQRGSRMPSSA